MQTILSLLVLTISFSLIQTATAKPTVIYGEDDRVDVFEERNDKFKELAKSTAAMISAASLKPLTAYETELGGSTLENRGVCKEERFANQPAVASCSGFLVGPDKLVTAGHCVQNERDCSDNVWVFDYRVEHTEQETVIVDNSDIYKCKRIISQDLDSETQNDYALIELEKVVEDRSPLKLRTSGAPKVGDELVVIGHPSGLPTKIAAGAKVRSLNDVFLVANLDTYGGNSGSAVFNATTGVVEGILVRGDQDYVWADGRSCRISNRIGNDEGRGEDVTLIKNVTELMNSEPPAQEPSRDLPDWLRWLLGGKNKAPVKG